MSNKRKILLIIGVVSCTAFAVYLPDYINWRDNAAKRSCIQNLKEIESAFEQYKNANNSPTNFSGTTNVVWKTNISTGVQVP
jgi:hypothetical protein